MDHNPPGKYLVWSLAFGPRGGRLAATWLAALQGAGKWRHDIILLGDHHIAGLTGPGLTVFDIRKDVAARHSLPVEQWTHWTLNNLKSQVQRYTDILAYDYILYLDIDVLANTDRLESLVVDKCRKGLIAVQEDCVPVSVRKLEALEKLGMPSRAELARWNRMPICAGIMGFPITATGLAVLKDYSRACEDMRFQGSDQAKLTAILNRDYTGCWSYLGDTVHGRRASPRYEETLVHFTGQRDAMLQAYYDMNLAPCGPLKRLRVRLRLLYGNWNYRRTKPERIKAYWQGAGSYEP